VFEADDIFLYLQFIINEVKHSSFFPVEMAWKRNGVAKL